MEEQLATIAHELRTPLAAIAGWARLLEEGALSAEQGQRAIAAILRSAAAQSRLIEDLLDAARGARGELRIAPERIEVAAVVSGAVAVVQPLAGQRQIELDAQLPPAAIEIWGDLERLQQVLINLLVNAVKFSPDRARVELRAERRGPFAALRVRDEGMGIRREFLPHLFERFRSDGPQHRGGGLGLGLAIARQIVELHRGTIRAHSDGVGRGATFHVELPLTSDVNEGTNRRARR